MPTVPAWIEDYATVVGPKPDDVIEEMDEYAVKKGFPTVGPAVGGWLEQLARMVGAESVFEFGSGYGYSAYWLARGLPATGEVVLTEIDKDELDLAREYLSRGDFETTIHYEHGDAIDIVGEYNGPFDVVLIDNEKTRYREAFEAVREKVAPGGIVVADNAITGRSIDSEAVQAVIEGERTTEAVSEMSAGIADLCLALRDATEYHSALLPLGEGVLVAYRD